MIRFTPEEATLIADPTFFRVKAHISLKVRKILEELHTVYRHELSDKTLLTPKNFESHAFQFVKGEHLEDFPYQYLDFPRFYSREEKFSFRSLFWWGHHMVFALLLEGGSLRQYKENLINRYAHISNRRVCLCLSGSLWEWKEGPGYTLELTHDRKSEVAAVLNHRPFFKLATFVPMKDPAMVDGDLVQKGQDAFRAMLPVITA